MLSPSPRLFPIKLKILSQFLIPSISHYSFLKTPLNFLAITYDIHSIQTMNFIIYFITFGLAIGLCLSRSNTCLDYHLRQGHSFSDAVINCQLKATSLIQFAPTTNLPSTQSQFLTPKALPPRFLVPSLISTNPPMANIKTYLPYVLGISVTLSLSILLSKFPFPFIITPFFCYGFSLVFLINFLNFSVLRSCLPQNLAKTCIKRLDSPYSNIFPN